MSAVSISVLSFYAVDMLASHSNNSDNKNRNIAGYGQVFLVCACFWWAEEEMLKWPTLIVWKLGSLITLFPFTSESVDVNVTPDKRQIFMEGEKILLATIKVSNLMLNN